MFVLTLAGLCALLLVSVGLSWPTNVLSDQSREVESTRVELTLPLPQGWAFFTRSPQEPSLVLYKQDSSGQWERADDLPQSQAKNLFGWSRNQRAQSTELAVIAQKVQFGSCDDYLTECLSSPGQGASRVDNTTNTHHFCGNFRIVVQYPVKWLYRHETPEDTRVSQFADVELVCG